MTGSGRSCRADPIIKAKPRSTGKPTWRGVHMCQHLSFLASGRPWEEMPRSEPDSGHPTVRDRRGACGNVAVMGVGLRPMGKPVDKPPNPSLVRAPHLYPTRKICEEEAGLKPTCSMKQNDEICKSPGRCRRAVPRAGDALPVHAAPQQRRAEMCQVRSFTPAIRDEATAHKAAIDVLRTASTLRDAYHA